MLARYRNLRKLGQGGMGAVYAAEDTTLHRPVALKFLSGALHSADTLRTRFLREARMAAALNHPGICTIHEVGEVQEGEEHLIEDGSPVEPGTPFIAMEMVEGSTLSGLIRQRGRLPIDELLDLAVQIADALAAAHARGIVHRDLKPANVMVTPDGRTKILDFGLAKPVRRAEADGDVLTVAEDVSGEITRAGMVMGTAAYMSPEQAAGRDVDGRSDVFSFGSVLYEMAAGERPFGGSSTVTVLSRILEQEPAPLSDRRPDLPPELLRIVGRCHKKPPSERYNDTRDLVAALKDLRQETTSGVSAAARSASTNGFPARAPSHRMPLWLGWALAGVGALGIVVAALWIGLGTGSSNRTAAPPAVHSQLTFTGKARSPDLSPDGQWAAYIESDGDSGGRVLVHEIAGGRPLDIFAGDEILSVRWSPSGSKLLISAHGPEGAATYLYPRLGGTPRRLPLLALAAWSPEGERIAGSFLPAKKIWIVGPEKKEIPLEGEFHWLLAIDWSSGGTLLFTTLNTEREEWILWAVSEDGSGQRVIVQEPRAIVSPRWSPAGDAVYYLLDRGETTDLMKIRVRPDSGEPKGPAETLMTGLIASAISISKDGRRMLTTRQRSESNLWLVEPGAAEPSKTQVTTGTVWHSGPAFSPDGSTLAFTRSSGGATNLFTLSFPDRTERQLTFFSEAAAWRPVWSPDGSEIAFGADEGDASRVWRVGASGGAPRAFQETRASRNLAWGPGRRIVYQRPGNQVYHLLDPTSGKETAVLTDPTAGWSFLPAPAPDNRRIAFFSNRETRGVYLVSEDDPTGRLLTAGALQPLRWSADGSWLYARLENRIVRVRADGGEPETVWELPFESAESVALSPDLGRYVATVAEHQSDIWLVENFD